MFINLVVGVVGDLVRCASPHVYVLQSYAVGSYAAALIDPKPGTAWYAHTHSVSADIMTQIQHVMKNTHARTPIHQRKCGNYENT